MTILFAATGSHVVRLERGGDDTWSSEIVLQDRGVQCVSVDPANTNRIFAGTFNDGLFRSLDGGQTWVQVSDGIPHERFPSVSISPSKSVNGIRVVYAGTEPSSLFISEDDGETWRDMPALRELPSAPTWSFPPRPWTSHVRWIAPSWHDPELIFAGIELGGVMRSTNGGETWEDRKPGSYHDSHCILTHPSDPNRIYEAAGGGVALSLDAGDTWQSVDDGMDRHYAWAMAVDLDIPDRWYVSASYGPRNAHSDEGNSEGVIFRKIGDAPWEALTNGLDHPMSEMPYSLIILRDEPATIYAGTRQGSLYVSHDRGDSWQRTNVSLDGILQLAQATDAD